MRLRGKLHYEEPITDTSYVFVRVPTLFGLRFSDYQLLLSPQVRDRFKQFAEQGESITLDGELDPTPGAYIKRFHVTHIGWF